MDAAFAVLLALVSTCLAHRFGTGNQEEHIPIVLRQLDPRHLIGDFFVSSTAEFGPRFYFARIVAVVAQSISLPGAYLVLRFASDLALIAVTQWAAFRVLGAERLGAMLAAVLTVTVSSFHLGDATELRYAVFQPASLAIPGMLLAVGMGLLGRPVAAALVASLSALPHPLYGTYGGVVGIVTAFVVMGLQGSARAIAWSSAGAAIFGASMLAFWWWPSQGAALDPLSNDELIAILGRFRAPHHYLPTEFRRQDYVITCLFVAVLGPAFVAWSRTASAAGRHVSILLLPVLLVGVGCACGVLFTEVWPSRTVMALQLFRLLSILKWIGFLLLGCLLASYWRRPMTAVARPAAAMSLVSVGGWHPLFTAAGLGLVRVYPRLARRFGSRLGIAVAIAAGMLSLFVGPVEERIRLAAALALVAAFAHHATRVRAFGAVAAIALVVIVADRSDSGAAPGPLVPIFSARDLQGPGADVARAAALHTPPEAVFVAPPDFGILRVVGQRALVVEFEAIPYQDRHMREWRQRIRNVYGEVDGGGHLARAALANAYRLSTDAHLLALAHRYGATHAVLYAETPTRLPELYSNSTFRIVRLQDPGTPDTRYLARHD